MEYVTFEEDHLDAIISLTASEGWPSLSADRARALRMMVAPGVTSVVAVQDGRVVGFARAFSDGELVAYLAEIAVEARHRGHGVGRALMNSLFERTKAERIDLLSLLESEGFYQSLPHRTWAGYRVYPDASE